MSKLKQLPYPSDIDTTATGRLLLIRAKRGEFGRTDFGTPPVMDVNRGWKIGDSARLGGEQYFLTHYQAALVAIGTYAIAEVPDLREIRFEEFRYPGLHEEWRPLIERKPVQSETRSRAKAAAK